jgi:NADPH:quinone reductase-like Zn-dependent oxidoreductase
MPAVPGFEGCGIIIGVGKSLDHDKWIGKRVSCFTQNDKDGCWANYFYAKPQEVMLIDESLKAEQAATFFINPFTAWGLCEIALQRESKAIVINAAGSMVAAFLFELATMHQIEVIGIVRKQETAKHLKASGWKNILVENCPDFSSQLKILLEDLAANTAFDAIAGSSAGLLLNALPPDSEVVVYGGLSNKSIADINPLGLIFDNKMITGFNLSDWMAETDSITFEVARNTLTEIILSGKVKNKVQTSYPHTEIKNAMKSYLGNMSAGKVLLTF